MHVSLPVGAHRAREEIERERQMEQKRHAGEGVESGAGEVGERDREDRMMFFWQRQDDRGSHMRVVRQIAR